MPFSVSGLKKFARAYLKRIVNDDYSNDAQTLHHSAHTSL